MINTYSESQLHKQLKTYYSDLNNGKTEQYVEGKICDIVQGNGRIYEIQTQNLSALKYKLKTLLPAHEITVIRPLAVTKYIEVYEKTGELMHRRKSPKKESVYAVFRELTGIYPYLTDPHFRLEMPEVIISEIRTKTDKPVQLPNKSRTFLKEWIKTGKRLEQMNGRVHIFAQNDDFLSILPKTLPARFCADDFAKAAGTSYANICLWILHKMALIRFDGTHRNRKYYTVSQ